MTPASSGAIADNVMHFVRLLRAAGLPVGTDRILTAVRTLGTVGLDRRDDVYWALHAVLVSQREQDEIFQQAFDLFFREHRELLDALSLLSPTGSVPGKDRRQAPRRLREAFGRAAPAPPPRVPARVGAALSASDLEILRSTDFAEMSADEFRRARELVARLPLTLARVPTRRLRPDPGGSRIDVRRMLRESLRSGGDIIPLRWRGPVQRPPPLVALCDISGSMERYVRILLHLLHALVNSSDRVHVFLFGTRLSHVTRALAHRDPDVALARLSDEVLDWSGGTRIGVALREFNRRWSRRLLAQGATVLLITDGLEREAPELLDAEAARLQRSCRRLVWLNPLLRYADFEPRARGIAALLRHADEFRPVHDLRSLEDLARALDATPTRPRRIRT